MMTIFSLRIHYPLPLPYMGKPDPRALQETVRQLRQEVRTFKTQVCGATQVRLPQQSVIVIVFVTII